MKSKEQDNRGVASIKRSGGLTNESKEKAELLNNQFKSILLLFCMYCTYGGYPHVIMDTF